MKLVGNTSNTIHKAVVSLQYIASGSRSRYRICSSRGDREQWLAQLLLSNTLLDQSVRPLGGRSLDRIRDSELTVRPLVGVDMT